MKRATERHVCTNVFSISGILSTQPNPEVLPYFSSLCAVEASTVSLSTSGYHPIGLKNRHPVSGPTMATVNMLRVTSLATKSTPSAKLTGHSSSEKEVAPC